VIDERRNAITIAAKQRQARSANRDLMEFPVKTVAGECDQFAIAKKYTD
jgi:hypothetical protein